MKTLYAKTFFLIGSLVLFLFASNAAHATFVGGLGKLVINKNASGADGTFTFTVSGPGSSSATITTSGGVGSAGPLNLDAGSYTITESNPGGWQLNQAFCDQPYTQGPNGLTGVSILSNQTTTCTFNNTFLSAPTISSISPNTAVAGSSSVTMTVTGSNFTSGAVVTFNGSSLATTFISATQLRATVPTANLTAAGTFAVGASESTGNSNTVTFTVTNPVPTVTTMLPTSTNAGSPDLTLTVNGTNFVSSSVIKFNGASKLTTFVSPTQLTTTLFQNSDLKTAGSFPVTVTNPAPGGGTAAPSVTFTVTANSNPSPTLASISPSQVAAGGAAFILTVNGSNFVSNSTVTVGGSSRTTTFVSPTQLTANIPSTDIASVGTLQITVVNPAPGGGTSNAIALTVSNPNPNPTITTISPSSVIAGSASFTLVVNGSNFVSNSSITVQGLATTTNFVSANQLTTSISPTPAAGTYSVTVVNPAPGGGTSNSATLTVAPNNQGNLIVVKNTMGGDSIFPFFVSGFPNFTITTVGGSGSSGVFSIGASSGTTVSETSVPPGWIFYSASCDQPYTVTSSTLSNVTIVSGQTTTCTFTDIQNNILPNIASISPSSKTVGDQGFTLTVNGSNFLSGATVNYNGSPRSTTFVSSNQLTAIITLSDLSATGTYGITVTNPSPVIGTSNSILFTVNPPPNPAPTIVGISPTSKLAGDPPFTLTINGNNFVPNATININGLSVATSFVSSTQVTAFISPTPAAGSYTVTVINPAPGGGTSNGAVFSVITPTPNPTITSIVPSSKTTGSGTFTLTVNGTNFISNSLVNFNGNTLATTFVSSTQLTATIPASNITNAGTYNITVTNPSTYSKVATDSNPVKVAASPDGNSVYVLSTTSLQKFRASDLTLVTQITIAGNAIAVSPDSSSVYVGANSGIQRLDASDLSQAAVNGGASALTMVVSPDGNYLYSLNASGFLIQKYDAFTLGLLGSTSTGSLGGGPGLSLTISPDGNSLYVGSGGGSTAFLQKFTAVPALNNWGNTTGNLSAMVNDGSYAYSIDSSNNNLRKFQIFGNTIAQTGSTATGVGPSGITIFGGNLFITNRTANTLQKFDATFLGSATTTVSTDSGPISVANSSNGTYIYVVNYISATLQKFNASDLSATQINGVATSNAVTLTVTNPIPVISSISPQSVIVASPSTSVTITGSGFVPTSTVTVNGSPIGATVVSSTQLTVVIPASQLTVAGTLPIFVTNPTPGGGVSNTVTFTVNNPTPTLSTISPTLVLAGGSGFTMSVAGTNFIPGSTVQIQGSNRTTTFISATQLTAAITAADIAAPGNSNITVSNPTPGGGVSNAVVFQVVTPNPVPTITTITPDTKFSTDTPFILTVNGSNFVSSSSITIQGLAVPTTFVSATQLTTLISPVPGTGAYSVTVINPAPGGGTSNSVTLTINNPVPFITIVSPNSATVGDPDLTIDVIELDTPNGKFIPESIVNLNGTPLVTTYNTAARLTAIIPASSLTTAGVFTITVTNPAPGGGTSSGVTFTVNNPAPSITSISPSAVTVNSPAISITVNGAGFVAGSTVAVNGSPRTTTFISATQLIANLPSTDLDTVGSFTITVANSSPGGGTSNGVIFTVSAFPVPTISTLSPSSVVVGSPDLTVTVTGTNFVSGSVVKFDGTVRTTIVVSDTQLTATILAADLASVGTYNITVTNPAPGGGTSNTAVFTVTAIPNPVPTITTISPSTKLSTDAPFTLTVNGNNFVSASSVIIQGLAVPTTFVSAAQLTTSIAPVPPAGTYTVTVVSPDPCVSTSGCTSNTVVLTINNPVPTTTSIDPASATVGGPAFSMTVNGSGFIADSIVNINGSPRATAYVSATQLTASILASDLTVIKKYSITVINSPPKGGTSNPQVFSVVPVPQGKLVIVKNTIGDDGTFTFDVSPTPTMITVTTTNTIGSSGTISFDAGNYDISEVAKTGWTLSSASCDHSSTATADGVTQVSIVANQTTTCTFSNTKDGTPVQTGIKIIKNTTAGDGTFSFNVTNTAKTTNLVFNVSTISTLGSSGIKAVDPGTDYTVIEKPPADWTFDFANCDQSFSTTQNGVTAVTVLKNRITTCTFTNSLTAGPGGGGRSLRSSGEKIPPKSSEFPPF